MGRLLPPLVTPLPWLRPPAPNLDNGSCMNGQQDPPVSSNQASGLKSPLPLPPHLSPTMDTVLMAQIRGCAVSRATTSGRPTSSSEASCCSLPFTPSGTLHRRSQGQDANDQRIPSQDKDGPGERKGNKALPQSDRANVQEMRCCNHGCKWERTDCVCMRHESGHCFGREPAAVSAGKCTHDEML